MEQLNIRIAPERENDRAAVFEVNRLAFAREEEAQLVNRLRGSAAFVPPLSLVATQGNNIVGYILFTAIRVSGAVRPARLLALAPLAVLPAYQRQGIGAMLVKKGLETARELGYEAVIVLGHEHYYPQFGFAPAGKWGITAPFEVPANAFMALELQPGALEGMAGVVEYAKEFEGV